MLYNHLASAYVLVGKPQIADQINEVCYRRFPDYLFARLGHASACLQRGEYEKVPEIIDNKFDLKLLYPNRSVFHITEVTAFMGIIGIYFVERNDLGTAGTYYEILEEIAPDAPVTRELYRRLQPGLLKKLIRNITGLRSRAGSHVSEV